MSRAGSGRSRRPTSSVSLSRTVTEGGDDSGGVLIRRRIDSLALPHTVELYNPKPKPDAAPGDTPRVWQVRDFSMEQVRSLVPGSADQLAPPKPARTAYSFFDTEKRPTLDNDKLYADARRDPARPKLATMQKRAIDELWKFTTTDDRAPFEELAAQDAARHAAELRGYHEQLRQLQLRAAAAELHELLGTLGPLVHWEEKLREQGLGTIAEMKSALGHGRWGFVGKLEDIEMPEHLRRRLMDALSYLAIARPPLKKEDAAKEAARAAKRKEVERERERRSQEELKLRMAGEEAQREVEKLRRSEERARDEAAIAEARLGMDDHGTPVDVDMAEQILAQRSGTGDMEGQEEFLVRWEFGTGMMSRDGLPIDRSWVPGVLLRGTPGSQLLIQDFFRDQEERDGAAFGAEVSIHFHALDTPEKALERKRTKIVTASASKLWDAYRAPLQLPVGAPKGLKPRDFLRVHRSLDQHGDGLVRPSDVAAMLDKLGLKLSVDETAEIVWEVDDDHTGALDVQDLVELYFRVCTDTTGCEPRRLFNLVEFLLFSAPSESELPKPGAPPMTQQEKDEARANAYTLEAEEATRMARNRYNGREHVPAHVKAYLERMDVQDMSITFVQFLHCPLALVPPNWVNRIVI